MDYGLHIRVGQIAFLNGSADIIMKEAEQAATAGQGLLGCQQQRRRHVPIEFLPEEVLGDEAAAHDAGGAEAAE